LTLIELLSYRLVDCTTPDDATRRRDPDTVSNYISIAVDAAPSHAAPCMQRSPAASIRPASAARWIGLCPEYANVPITPKIGQSGGRWRLVATGRIHPLIDAWRCRSKLTRNEWPV
jgi:hypothetical protein